MNLLIDLGITRLKWATLEHGQLRPGGVFTHHDRNLAMALRKDWSILPRRLEVVLVSSVVTEPLEGELAAACRSLFDIDPKFLKTPEAALGVRTGHKPPAELAIDRFLALVAVHVEQPRAQVLVSCGTAMTLDAIGADGQHHGGLIVASPTLMRSALRSAMPNFTTHLGQTVEIATARPEAVQSGALLAAVALIERFRRNSATWLGEMPALIVAGGGSIELASLLPDSERRSDLVLHGLARWSEAEASA